MSPGITTSVWQLPAPDIGHHLPGGAFTLDASPPPKRNPGLGSTRCVHAMVTAISGVPHHPTMPTIALAPWPTGIGWAAYLAMDGAAEQTAGRTHRAHLYGKPCDVRCGPLMRLKAPVVSDVGPRELVVRTQTPLVIRGNGRIDSRDYRPRRRPTGAALTSTLWSWIPRRVGLELGPETVRTELLDQRGRFRTVRLGGHLGSVRGWEGTMRVRTNAVGEWLLRVGALLGIGGRVGYGFGRVEVDLA